MQIKDVSSSTQENFKNEINENEIDDERKKHNAFVTGEITSNFTYKHQSTVFPQKIYYFNPFIHTRLGYLKKDTFQNISGNFSLERKFSMMPSKWVVSRASGKCF